jgi:hypothetical protein
MDNPEKLATQVTQDEEKNNKRNQTQCVLDITLRKHTQITLITHEPFWRQTEHRVNAEIVAYITTQNPKGNDTH